MNLKIVYLILRVALIIGLLWTTPPIPAFASGVVGTGTPASCTEAALDAALVGGGVVTFNCGAAPHTIQFSGPKSIVDDTTIDGGDVITLSGQDATRLFEVSNGAALILRNIVLTNGFSTGNGGAIHNGSSGSDMPGSVTLENSIIRNSKSNLSGGAIVSTGPLTITNSLLENNQALNGGALYPRFAGARTTIISSTLRYNQATDATNGWGGALLVWDGARVTIQGNDIFSNTARQGGGIYAFANSSLTLSGGTLRENSATGNGGGLYNAITATLTLTGVTFSGNTAGAGGGLYNDGTATLTNVTLSGNTTGAGGGLSNYGIATLTNVTLSGNTAFFGGGGLYNYGTATLTNVTLSGNTAGAGGGLYNDGTATLTNITLSGNSAGDYGGGLSNYGIATLTNVTLSGNTAGAGGGLYNYGITTLNHTTFSGNTAGVNGGGIHRALGTVAVRASIVASSPSGGNCSGGVTNNGFNLSTDASCGGFNQVANVMLGSLGNNGGPTQTHLPQPGSPAIDFVATNCPPPAADQRGASRPVDGDGVGGAACDAGAVEYGAVTSVVYLPLLIK